jgi:hypothetical protein
MRPAPPAPKSGNYVLTAGPGAGASWSASGGKMKKNDSTEVMRVRQSVERNKVPLIVCTLLAIVGVIGWLTTLS